MISAFLAGGIVMIPVTITGVLAVAVSLRHAALPGVVWGKAGASLRAATLLFTAGGCAMDFMAVSGAAAAAEGQMMTTILAVGSGEALAPLMFGGLLAGASALLGAVGDFRCGGHGCGV